METILPILKYIFFHFDYFLIVLLVIIWFFVRKKPETALAKRIINLANMVRCWFEKLLKIKVWKLLLVVFVINLIVRFLMIVPIPEIAFWDIMGPHYLNLAQSLYNGEGFITHVIWNNFIEHPEIVRPDFFRMPVYPLLVTLVYHIFGNSHLVARLVNVLFGALVPLAAYLLAYTLTKSKRISILLLLFMSSNTLLLFWMPNYTPDIVYAVMTIMCLYFIYQARNKSAFYALMAGVFWALTYLTRTEGLYIFLVVIFFIYFYHLWQKKRELLLKLALTILGFVLVASPYLIRNYKIKGSPVYSDFDKIVMESYYLDEYLINEQNIPPEQKNSHKIILKDCEYLVESPKANHKNIYDLVRQEPINFIRFFVQKFIKGIILIPGKLIYSYAMFVLCVLGIYYVWKKEKQKYYFMYLAIFFGFLLPTVTIYFTPRYYTPLLVLFYLFIAIAIFKLLDERLKDKVLVKSLLIIYVFMFIVMSWLTGIGKGTLPYIPHSFYKRFDAHSYYGDLQKFYNYARDNIPAGDVVMIAKRPYEFYYFTQKPTVMFPFANNQDIQKFIKKYKVKWFVCNNVPKKVGDKYFGCWLEGEIPENIKPVFSNTGGRLYKIVD